MEVTQIRLGQKDGDLAAENSKGEFLPVQLRLRNETDEAKAIFPLRIQFFMKGVRAKRRFSRSINSSLTLSPEMSRANSAFQAWRSSTTLLSASAPRAADSFRPGSADNPVKENQSTMSAHPRR